MIWQHWQLLGQLLQAERETDGNFSNPTWNPDTSGQFRFRKYSWERAHPVSASPYYSFVFSSPFNSIGSPCLARELHSLIFCNVILRCNLITFPDIWSGISCGPMYNKPMFIANGTLFDFDSLFLIIDPLAVKVCRLNTSKLNRLNLHLKFKI